MDRKDEYIRLVRGAQLGNEGSISELAELSRERLRAYVFRLVLDKEMAEDVIQETIIDMLKVLGKLKDADRFWPWLCGIALNKLRRHERSERGIARRHRKAARDGDPPSQSRDGFEELVSKELKEIISRAMGKLKTKQRAVLVMRCYEEMSYAEISELLGCSEFYSRVQFCRAKKSLAKELSRLGLGKGGLLTALIIFGKMTATSGAAAAKVSVTAGTIKVGVAAGAAVMLGGKATMVTMGTVGALAVGNMVVSTGQEKISVVEEKGTSAVSQYESVVGGQISEKDQERWYYYPAEGNGAVMMQIKSRIGGKGVYYQWLENEQGNYYKRGGTIYLENYRSWDEDYSVRRLPTDSKELRDFISRVEGSDDGMEYVRDEGDGLLVVVRQEKEGLRSQVAVRYDVSDEEYFRYNLSGGGVVVDNRDQMHRQAWTYFRINGEIGGQEVSGTGRVPFVYSAYDDNRPWVRFSVGDKNISGGERLFTGIGRPWMGLHTVDMIRRDAAERKIWFETEYWEKGGKTQVTLDCDGGRIVYTIDMKKDLIEKITLEGEKKGWVVFTYLDDVDDIYGEFAAPGRSSKAGTKAENVLELLIEK